MSVQFAAHQDEYIANPIIDVELGYLRLGFSSQATDASEDGCGTMAVADDAFGGLTRFVKIRVDIFEPARACFRIGHDCHERLVHFMGDRRREFAHRRQPRRARKLRLHCAQRLLCAFAIGDVNSHYTKKKLGLYRSHERQRY